MATITPNHRKLQPSFRLDIMRNCEGLQSATLLDSRYDVPHPEQLKSQEGCCSNVTRQLPNCFTTGKS